MDLEHLKGRKQPEDHPDVDLIHAFTIFAVIFLITFLFSISYYLF